MAVDQLGDSSRERDHWRYIIPHRYKRHLLMITKRILIQERSIRTNGCLDEGCVEIHDVSKLILRKSVSDRPVNMEIYEQPDSVGRQRSNSISSWDKLNVPRPRVPTTAAEDFANATDRQTPPAA